MQNGDMYTRLLRSPPKGSFFLFGPRGTGKTTWLKSSFPMATYLDLLDASVATPLMARPSRLAERIPPGSQEPVVLDEIQKVPALLDEVHRLIETRNQRFVLTGSSARKLRRAGVNLLAGRAYTYEMYPLTVAELGIDFELEHALRYGLLPVAWTGDDPGRFLAAYVHTYLREEVQQEGLTRNLGAFSRFLEAASFSQGAALNVSQVARECSVHRKVVESYFAILRDLLLAWTLPVFRRRARRRMAAHPKFYFFDAGVYRSLRPAGPLDRPAEIDGAALETLVLQELRALNAYLECGYELCYWRTAGGLEVDFVLYGERGLLAIEVTRAAQVRPADLRGLKALRRDLPMARSVLLYGGRERLWLDDIEVIPLVGGLRALSDLLAAPDRGDAG